MCKHVHLYISTSIFIHSYIHTYTDVYIDTYIYIYMIITSADVENKMKIEGGVGEEDMMSGVRPIGRKPGIVPHSPPLNENFIR
jgi:hypothetical protein